MVKRGRGVLIAICVVVAVAAPAHARRPARQAVSGSILAPGPNGPVYGKCDVPEGPLYQETSGAWPNGVFGYLFEVDPHTANRPFGLATTDQADLDIYFFRDGGSPTDPSSRPSAVEFATRTIGGEHGKVPAGYKLALVCIASGESATFDYVAGPRKAP